MLNNSNIMAFVDNCDTYNNVVMFWDDQSARTFTSLSMDNEMEVLGLFLLYDRIIVIQKQFIFNFVLTDLTYESHIETYENEKGLCEVCKSPQDPIPSVIVFPGGLTMSKHRVGFRFAINTCITTFPLPIFEDATEFLTGQILAKKSNEAETKEEQKEEEKW